MKKQVRSSKPQQTTSAPAEQPQEQSPTTRVDFEKRQANRQLSTEQVLALLKRWLPVAFERAEVVGQWVWVSFTEKQPQSLTAELSQLGFHWNNRRQVWQHPCGVFRGEPVDPRAKYSTASAQEVVA